MSTNAPAPVNPALVVRLFGLGRSPVAASGVRGKHLCGWLTRVFTQIRKIGPGITIFSVPFARGGVIPFGGRSVGRLVAWGSVLSS